MQFKLIITALFCMICSSVLHADYNAADLQKLFTDKKQRARIDATRSGKSTVTDVRKQTRKIKVSGYVTRSKGESVVWVNDKNTLEGSIIGDIKVQQSNIGKNKKVGVTLDDTHVHLKPGETWYQETGKVKDNY